MKTFDLFSDFDIVYSERPDGSFRSAESIKNYFPEKKYQLKYLKLEHSDRICEVEESKHEYIGDAITSRNNSDMLGMVVGDCFPLIIVNQDTKDVALVHCGWKSLTQNIIKLTLIQLSQKSDSNKSNFSAWIGPGISEKAYLHHPPIVQHYLPKWFPFIKEIADQRYSIDLQGFILHELTEAGLAKDKIFFENRCTFTEKGSFFSHFRAKSQSDEDGRFFVCILPKN